MMYYADLSPYRGFGDSGGPAIYPAVRNVGWLSAREPFTKGSVDAALVQKLREILFLDLKSAEDKRAGRYDPNRAVNIHTMHVRGPAHACEFCDKTIAMAPGGLAYYSGTREMDVGVNEVCIPAPDSDRFFSFPTMLHHYITVHEYRPPQEFLDALAAFDLDAPFDIDGAFADLECVEVRE